MADFRCIEGASAALVTLLRMSYDKEDFVNDLQFQVYVAENFSSPMPAGVSIFLYRVTVNGNHRMPVGRTTRDAQFHTKLPLDLHYLMTVWAQDASLQHRIVGWLMRVMEDSPILSSGLLESAANGVFQPDEMLEVLAADMTSESMFNLWQTLGSTKYQLSIPYLVRNVSIESERSKRLGAPVQTRQFDVAKFGQSVSHDGSPRA